MKERNLVVGVGACPKCGNPVSIVDHMGNGCICERIKEQPKPIIKPTTNTITDKEE